MAQSQPQSPCSSSGPAFKPRTAQSALTRPWAREYLPGYTGHVPTKNDFCGKTSGSINREICVAGGKQSNLEMLELQRHESNKIVLPSNKSINRDVFGNSSRHAKNWVSGPTHQIRQQHIPNYTGHCRGMVNKDFMSKSYAKVTAELFARQHPMGDDTDPKTRFTSTQRFAYKPSNFRRWVDQPQMIPQKDYNDFAKFVNDNNAEKKSNLLQRTLRNGGSACEQKTHKTLITQTGGFFSSGKPRTFSVDVKDLAKTQVKPKLLESKISTNEKFFNLTDSFKEVFANDKKDQSLVIPVVGYGGHRRGDRSQNFFGKSFRDTTIQSKYLEREFRPSKQDS